MDFHVDIRGFLEIHAWICYGFSDQGYVRLRYEPVYDTHCLHSLEPSPYLMKPG